MLLYTTLKTHVFLVYQDQNPSKWMMFLFHSFSHTSLLSQTKKILKDLPICNDLSVNLWAKSPSWKCFRKAGYDSNTQQKWWISGLTSSIFQRILSTFSPHFPGILSKISRYYIKISSKCPGIVSNFHIFFKHMHLPILQVPPEDAEGSLGPPMKGGLRGRLSRPRKKPELGAACVYGFGWWWTDVVKI